MMNMLFYSIDVKLSFLKNYIKLDFYLENII